MNRGLTLAIFIVSGVGVGLLIGSGQASVKEVAFWLMVGFFVANLILNRRVQRGVYSMGYWVGRGDETVTHAVAHMHQLEEASSEEEAETHLAERQQLVAQQVAKRNVEVPEGWPTWDGIDRLALMIPTEFHQHMLPDLEEPGFMQPLKWPWQRRGE